MGPNELPWQPIDATNRRLIACLNFGGEMGLYASGFQDGADELFKALQEHGHSQDLLVYPLVYCLRHAVELSLKQVIRAGRQLHDEPSQDFPDGHSLSTLWATCRPLLKRIWEEEEPTYQAVEATVSSLSQIDPTNDGFRYPITSQKSGRKPTLIEGLKYLDLEQMYLDVTETLNLLGGAEAGIDHYMDAKADMNAESDAINREMRAEYDAEMRRENEDGW
jgi:hypothetical protein